MDIKTNTEDLDQTKQDLEVHANNTDNEMTELKEQMSDFDKFIKTGTSCDHLAKLGFNKSNDYYLDNDGIGQGKAPFKVWQYWL